MIYANKLDNIYSNGGWHCHYSPNMAQGCRVGWDGARGSCALSRLQKIAQKELPDIEKTVLLLYEP